MVIAFGRTNCVKLRLSVKTKTGFVAPQIKCAKRSKAKYRARTYL